MEIQKKKEFIIKILYYALIFCIIYIIFRFSFGLLFPFIISFILVSALRKPSLTLAKKFGLRQKAVNILSVLLFYSLLMLVMLFVISVTVRQMGKSAVTESLINFVSVVLEKSSVLIGKLEAYLPNNTLQVFNSFTEELSVKFSEYITNLVSGLLSGAVSSLPKFLFAAVVTVVSSCYFANEYEPLKNFFVSIIPKDKEELTVQIKRVISENIIKIIKGYAIISLIIFIICFIGFAVLGNKNAFLMAIAVTLVDLLPVLGVGTVLLPWCVIEFIRGNILLGVGLIAIYVCSLVAHHMLEPRFIGKNIGIPPFISLVLMFILLKLFGFLGMITALLALVVVINLYREDIIR